MSARGKDDTYRTVSLLVAALVAGAFYWHWTQRFDPTRRTGADAALALLDLENKRNEFALRETGLQQTKQASQEALDRLQTDRAALVAERAAIGRHLLSPADLSDVESAITRLADAAGVTLESLDKRQTQPRMEDEAPAPFIAQRYVLQGAGEFPALVSFLSLLESAPWPVRIVQAELGEGREDAPASAFQIELQALLPGEGFAIAVSPLPPLPEGLSPVAVRDLFPPKSKVEAAPKAAEKKPVDFGTIELTGILGSSADRAAIVNGEILRIGGSINGSTVVGVETDRVVLEKEGERREVRMSASPDADGSAARP